MRSPIPSRPIVATILALGLTSSGYAQSANQTAPDDFSDLAQEDAEPEEPAEIAPEVETALLEMDAVITAIDEEAVRNGNMWEFSVEDQRMLAVTDPAAGRMRVISPIAEVDGLPEDAMQRLMQANFDTALDARYAVANGLVWGAFIHPLDSLTTRDFASGILQVRSLAATFGTTFSSGALNYGGGDSSAIIDEQLKELLEELEKRETI